MFSKEAMKLAQTFGANNYHPLPVVLAKAEGVWAEDPEGRRYMDFLSGYSALNQGHRHPEIIKALNDQAERITLTSRAFYNDQLGQWFERICKLTNKDMALPMNTGAEAVETAIKAARRWAYDVKGIPRQKAEIIVCSGNFHGRTMAAVSISDDPDNQRNYGPLLPGFKVIPYGDLQALEESITEYTAAFLFEPIQGEAGVIVPPEGYIRDAIRICKERRILSIADEIQTGLGRTGRLFACDWEETEPDMYVLGKALGGGVMPISAVVASKDILGVFTPGSHGSTFGGNPLACAVSIASLDVIENERLAERAQELGAYLMERLKSLHNASIKEIRGKGLLIGMELHHDARSACEALLEHGLLAKETHERVIRFAPPLIITQDDLDWAFERIKRVFA